MQFKAIGKEAQVTLQFGNAIPEKKYLQKINSQKQTLMIMIIIIIILEKPPIHAGNDNVIKKSVQQIVHTLKIFPKRRTKLLDSESDQKSRP